VCGDGGAAASARGAAPLQVDLLGRDFHGFAVLQPDFNLLGQNVLVDDLSLHSVEMDLATAFRQTFF
jgi:hypothetical protein